MPRTKHPPTPGQIIDVLVAHDKAPDGATIRDVARVAGVGYDHTASVVFLDLKGSTYQQILKYFGWPVRRYAR